MTISYHQASLILAPLTKFDSDKNGKICEKIIFYIANSLLRIAIE